MDWAGRRVLVTGARGFLGRRVVAALEERGAAVVAAGREDADLRERAETLGLFERAAPEVVIHAAVEGGGLGWMQRHPVESGLNTARMNLNALEAARAAGAAVFIGVSSACVYPRLCPVPFVESAIWDGYPEPSNGPYGIAKRQMMDLGAAYTRQYGLRTAFPVLANLYGPGDATDPARAHVVADLMLRCASLTSRPPGEPRELVVWGTGTPTREFLYVDDAAEGVLACADGEGAINVGSGQEIAIRDLARAVLDAWGLDVPLRLDPTRPDGQPRKCLAVERAARELGWRARTSLEQGLTRTALWYAEALRA